MFFYTHVTHTFSVAVTAKPSNGANSFFRHAFASDEKSGYADVLRIDCEGCVEKLPRLIPPRVGPTQRMTGCASCRLNFLFFQYLINDFDLLPKLNAQLRAPALATTCLKRQIRIRTLGSKGLALLRQAVYRQMNIVDR